MTTNESQLKPGFLRNANDLLGIPEGTKPRFINVGDVLGKVMNDYHERRAQEEAKEERNHVATRSIVRKTVSEPNMPEQTPYSSESEEVQDTREKLSINEVRQRMHDDYNDALDYATQTGDRLHYVYTDPRTFARNHHIRIV